MSTTIPYDPSLVLGNIVPEKHLENLEAISKIQAPIDADLGELNSALLLKHKLEMTLQELANMGVATKPVTDQMDTVDKAITGAAGKYAKTAAASLPAVAAARAKIEQVGESIESPIDYNKSSIKKMPLSADSLTMDAQYFSFDETRQSSESVMASMKSFVSASSSFLGNERSAQMTATMQDQVSHQREVHDIQGTLVITANCTHKNAALFAPFVIDVDKGIRAWNELVKLKQLHGTGQFIKTDDRASFEKAAEQSGTAEEAYYNLLSGATYGSSFVGMVHVLKEAGTQSDQSMYSAAASLQAQMKVGGWFSNFEGGFGVSSSFSHSAKQLLSQQKITSHISIICMGLIPSIVANDVELAVKQFTNFDPAAMMEKLQTLQNATAAEQASISQAADAARTGGQMMSIHAAEIKSVMSAVSEHQDGSNKMLDINSLMTAFTDYVNKAGGGDIGVPIEYYLKPITANQLFQMWVAKYFPAKYVTSAGDDTTPNEPTDDSSDQG